MNDKITPEMYFAAHAPEVPEWYCQRRTPPNRSYFSTDTDYEIAVRHFKQREKQLDEIGIEGRFFQWRMFYGTEMARRFCEEGTV